MTTPCGSATTTDRNSTSGAEPIASPSATASASAQLIARRLLAAYEREFWAGHHDRSRLLAAPLRVLHQALPPGADATDLLSGVLQVLGSAAGAGTTDNAASD